MPDLLTAYTRRVPLLTALAASLEEATKLAVGEVLHIDRVSYRVKKPDSFVDKAEDPTTQPPYEDPLAQIEDQVAGRVIVFFLNDLDIVKQRLLATFNPVEMTHKRPAKDDAFGYESHHLILIIPPHLKPSGWFDTPDLPTTFEMQVRTLFMHAWSEPQHDLAYKAVTDLTPQKRRELAWVAASAWGADQALDRVSRSQEGTS